MTKKKEITLAGVEKLWYEGSVCSRVWNQTNTSHQSVSFPYWLIVPVC